MLLLWSMSSELGGIDSSSFACDMWLCCTLLPSGLDGVWLRGSLMSPNEVSPNNGFGVTYITVFEARFSNYLVRVIQNTEVIESYFQVFNVYIIGISEDITAQYNTV